MRVRVPPRAPITKGRKMEAFAAGLWVFLCGFVFGYYVVAPLIWKLKDFLERNK